MATTSPLRQRMIEDMMIRNFSRATQQSYIYAVARFSRHFNSFPIVSAWRRSAPTSCISSQRTIRGRTSTKSHAPCGSSMALPWDRRRPSNGSFSAESLRSFRRS